MASEIYIKYSVDTADLQKATSIWDKLTQEEQEALSKLKEFNLTLKGTGEAGETAGRKLKGLGAGDSIARMRDQVQRLRQEIELLSPASEEFGRKMKELKSVEGNLAGVTKGVDGASGSMGGLMGMATKLIPVLTAVFSVKKAMEFAQQAVQVSIQFDAMRRGMEAAAGGTIEAGRSFEFISDISNRLGLNLLETASGYKSFAAAGRSAGLELNEQEKIFSSVSEAGMRMGLTNEQLSGTFMALTQMLSKGTVQAEELRGQLSERIPGSFGVMARAVGVTERELGKMLEKGEVIAKDVLPKFAEELNRTFGGGNGELINSAAAATSRLDTEWAKFLDSVGQKLQPAYQKGLEATADFIRGVRNILGETKEDPNTTFKLAKQVQADFQKFQQLNAKYNVEAADYQAKGLVNLAKDARSKITDNYTILNTLADKYNNEFQEKTGQTMESFQRALQFQAGESLNPEEWKGDIKARLGALGSYTEEYAKIYGRMKEVKRLMTVDAVTLGKEFTKPPIDPKALKAAEKAAKEAEKAAKEAEEAVRREYQAKKDAIELQKKIDEERIKQTVAPEGQQMARKELEMATNIELLALAKEYEDKKVLAAKEAAQLLPAIIATQNKEIADQYQSDDKTLREQRIREAKELWSSLYQTEMQAIDKRQSEATIKILNSGLSDKQVQKQLTETEIAFNQERIDLNNSYATIGLEEASANNDKLLEENARKNRELKKQDQEAAEERAKIFEKVFELSQTIVSGSFDLYQSKLEKEMSLMKARYDREIEMAGGNQQKIDELNQRKREEEKELRIKMFKAEQAQAISRIMFSLAEQVMKYAVESPPLAILSGIIAAAQIGQILAQPIPEFAEGTKGKPFKGGLAMVGERGTERIVTESGKVYYTPPTATLMELPKGSQVIPNHLLSQQEINYASTARERYSGKQSIVTEKLSEIGAILKNLPVHQINMDERGFQKYIRTPNRTVQILNNRFGVSK
jgi:tape measure domain-containing protein